MVVSSHRDGSFVRLNGAGDVNDDEGECVASVRFFGFTGVGSGEFFKVCTSMSSAITVLVWERSSGLFDLAADAADAGGLFGLAGVCSAILFDSI
jgi:hypothetical protein